MTKEGKIGYNNDEGLERIVSLGILQDGIIMERKFSIITDSSSDLPAEYFSEHEIDCVNLGFLMDSVIYEGADGEHMDVKEFYARLRNGSMPTTFQVSPEFARSFIEPKLQQGKDVLVLAFSSGLSGTYNSFYAAAQELSEQYPDRKIVVVDSLCASMGEGLFVDYVVGKADMGASLEETAAYAEDLKLHICHEFTVDDLYHLKRGGRVSATAAFVGTMLRIKPVMHVDNEGHLIVLGKAMGRKKSISALVEAMKSHATLDDSDPVFISHGDCMEDVEYLIGLVKKEFGEDRRICVNYVGSVIGAHSGPGTLALFYRGSNR